MCTDKNRRKVALYGGSFDPVHCGHLAVIKHILNQGTIDQVYVIPSGRHPFKEDTLFTFSERMKLLESAVSSMDNVVLSALDEMTNDKSYTIDLVRAFRNEHPDDDLYFVIGEDLVTQLKSWKEYRTLLKEVKILVMSRETADRNLWKDLDYIDQLAFIKMDLITISSSELRLKIEKNEDISFFVPKEIVPLIQGFIEKKRQN